MNNKRQQPQNERWKNLICEVGTLAVTKKCIQTQPTQTSLFYPQMSTSIIARVLNSFMKNENLSISKVPRLSQNMPVQIGLNVFASPFN